MLPDQPTDNLVEQTAAGCPLPDNYEEAYALVHGTSGSADFFERLMALHQKFGFSGKGATRQPPVIRY